MQIKSRHGLLRIEKIFGLKTIRGMLEERRISSVTPGVIVEILEKKNRVMLKVYKVLREGFTFLMVSIDDPEREGARERERAEEL